MTDSAPIGIGIIGSGFMARTYAACLASYVRGARLVAVAGGSRAPQLAADYGVTAAIDVSTLVEDPNVAAVIIATPESTHRDLTILAARAGKHVLVEKPMAPTVHQCDEMIEACNQANVQLMVVQSQRFRGVHRRAYESLSTGQIGKVRQIRHWSHQTESFSAALAAQNPFVLDPAGIGLQMGWSVHSFDLVRWLAGSEARSVFAHATTYSGSNVSDLSLMAQIEFLNGVTAQIWVCLEMPGATFSGSPLQTQVVGESGLMSLDGYAHFDLSTGVGWERIWQQPPMNLSDPSDPVRLESFSRLVQEFIDAIQAQRPPSVTGLDGRAAVALCLAALESAKRRQPVNLV